MKYKQKPFIVPKRSRRGPRRVARMLLPEPADPAKACTIGLLLLGATLLAMILLSLW